MKKIIGLLFGIMLSACSYVGPGEEGVMVNSLGDNKGVVKEALTTGYYYTGFFSTVYSFPTFTQNYNWTAQNHEQIGFADAGGLPISADIGISYHIEPGKVTSVFQKYRRGIDEITDIYLHNMVQEAFNVQGSKHPIEYIYGEGKSAMIGEVQKAVAEQVQPIGIVIENLFWRNQLGLPEATSAAINAKTNASQLAQQKENELAASKADAAKTVAAAQGEADSTLLKARAQAQANKILAESLTKDFVQYQEVLRWDGKVPMVSGNSSGLLLNMQGQTR